MSPARAHGTPRALLAVAVIAVEAAVVLEAGVLTYAADAVFVGNR
jgi:hypothetical protein